MPRLPDAVSLFVPFADGGPVDDDPLRPNAPRIVDLIQGAGQPQIGAEGQPEFQLFDIDPGGLMMGGPRPLAGAIVRIPVPLIKTMQSRKDTTKTGVRSYRELLRAGESIPPVEVMLDTKTGQPYLLDGHHRLAAYKAEGMADIPARISGHAPRSSREALEMFREFAWGYADGGPVDAMTVFAPFHPGHYGAE